MRAIHMTFDEHILRRVFSDNVDTIKTAREDKANLLLNCLIRGRNEPKQIPPGFQPISICIVTACKLGPPIIVCFGRLDCLAIDETKCKVRLCNKGRW